MMRILILSLFVLLTGAQAAASPFGHSDQLSQYDQTFTLAQFTLAQFQPASENRFLPGKPRSRVGEKKAASRAKQEFPDSKVLSVNYMKRSNAFRVKLLSDGGVVKYVFVDPQSGEVYQ